jgi:ATP-dependent helicase/nuclease subunit B
MAIIEILTTADCEAPDDPWLARLADHLRDLTQSALCVVPTGDAARRLEERLIADFDLPGLFGGPIRTFYRLARDIARDTRLGGHDLSDLQRSLLLQQIADAAGIPTLSRIQRFPGFAAALGDLIGEMKLAMVHPEALKAALERLPQSEASLRAKLADILKLYQRYQEILQQQGLHDAEGLMWHAVSELEKAEATLPAGTFFFHGFRSFNEVQLRLIKAIAGTASQVLVKLHYDPTRSDSFVTAQRTIAALEAMGARSTRSDVGDAGDTDPAHIAANLFRPDAPKRPPDGSLAIIEAGSPALEADQVGREIQRLVADGRACYPDIAVILRGRDARTRFAHVLSHLGVPIRKRKEPLGTSAMGRMVLGCLRVVRDGWPVAAVGTLLKSPCLPGDPVARARAEVNAWQEGVQEDSRHWFEPWSDDDTQSARVDALTPVRDFEVRLRKASSLADMAQAVRTLMEACERPDAANPEARRDDDAAREALDRIIAEVETIAPLAANAVEVGAFCDDFERAIADARYAPGPRQAEGITLIDAQALGGQTYRAVFVVNLLEKIFPALVRENPFLRDREREALQKANPDVRLALSSENQDEERLLFWRAASCATERLYLSYPLADENAKESLPSFYVDEVVKLFSPEPERTTRGFSDLTPAPQEAVTGCDWAACILHGMTRDLPVPAQAQVAAHFNAWITEGETRLGSYLMPAPDYADVLADPSLLAALEARERPYRPTELEDYLTCPYLYFCSRLLEVRSVERVIEPVDRGILVHDVMARLYREWHRKAGAPIDVTSRTVDKVVARALRILDATLKRQPRFANLPTAEREIEHQTLRAVLQRFVAADIEQTAERGLRPAFFELQFGARPRRSADERSRPEPLDLGGKKGSRVLISGRMDRVDLTSDGRAVVIDYKLSRTLRDLRDVEQGLLVQAPLYSMAVRDLFGMEVVGAEYVSIGGCDRTGMYSLPSLPVRKTVYNLVKSPNEFEDLLDTAAAAARDCVARIRRGDIRRGPRDECPEYCGYRPICRVDAWTLRRIQAQRGVANDG